MSIKINLSGHSDKFAAECYELTFTKNVNFIFGRNGTGKTTIASEIKNQLTGEFDVCLFNDFDGVAENARLDAISLGTENAAIQKKLNAIDKEIIEIMRQTESPKDSGATNLYANANKARLKLVVAEKVVDAIYTDAAKQIKEQANPPISKPGYNKKDFKNEISKAQLLAESDIALHKGTIKSDEKADIEPFALPIIDLQKYLDPTNEVLSISIPQPQAIPGLHDNASKQAFAKQGMEVHEQTPGEVCAFCGNEISPERWRVLGDYFNAEVKKLEARINDGITKISQKIDSVQNTVELNEKFFYEKFSQDVQKLNAKIKIKKAEYKEFLEQLKNSLESKKQNLFSATEKLELVVPMLLVSLQQELDTVITNHNQLSKKLASEQSNAKDALRFHEIKVALSDPKYGKAIENLSSVKLAYENAQNLLDEKKLELAKKQDERKNLIMQTKNEEKIAEKINKLLANTGVTSFSLKLIESDEENQKGQYQIEGHNKELRKLTQLSKGEKNIIAFLYFIFSLENIDRENVPRIIVFDDPMTSNDDTMQYLIMTEIQKLYQKYGKDNYVFVLTHNAHFYLNVRPSTMPTYKDGKEISFYEKYGTYHLFSTCNLTSIKNLTKGKHDFSTSYDLLWKELVFIYDAEGTTPNLMLNSCRRICETYLKFTKLSYDKFWGDNKMAIKLFNVNSHAIDDYVEGQNNHTKDEIKTMLEELFKANGAKEHFDTHWKGGAQYERN
ncbi:MAG: AAA family ATPase [Defluviitaleaceae bacterium]|nr:AAA family ATPase [Defluviitaleaceae bacterium]